ncbi:hypothetical protein [Photobacterium damselae]
MAHITKRKNPYLFKAKGMENAVVTPIDLFSI